MGAPFKKGQDPVVKKRDYLKELAEMPIETTYPTILAILARAILQLKEELDSLKTYPPKSEESE